MAFSFELFAIGVNESEPFSRGGAVVVPLDRYRYR